MSIRKKMVPALSALFLCSLAALALPARGASVGGLIGPGANGGGWRFDLGREFPGAKGTQAFAAGGAARGPELRISADFAGGGQYVQSSREIDPSEVESLSFDVLPPEGARCIVLRLTDGSGQCHQVPFALDGKAAWRHIDFPLARFFAEGPSSVPKGMLWRVDHWGGANDGKWHQPLRGISVVVPVHALGSGKAGTFTVAGLALVTVPGRGRLSVSSPRFGALYGPEEKIVLDWKLEGRETARPRELVLSVRDWREREIFRRLVADRQDAGTISIEASDLNGRIGAFGVRLSVPGEETSGETWVARLSSKDRPKPCRWAGTGTHGWYGWASGDLRYLELVSAAGLGIVRDEIGWANVERKKGEYALPPKFEALVNELHRRGIRFNNLLNSPNPAYENPLDPEAFARYCAWHAKALGDRCDLYEIWNEPRNFHFFEGYRKSLGYGTDRGNEKAGWIEKFVAFSRGAADAIHAANPRADVALCAEDWWKFAARMLELGIARPGEIVSLHTYDHHRLRPEGDYFNETDGKAIFDYARAHGGVTRVAVTEDGWTTYLAGKDSSHAFVGNYPPSTYEEQARYLIRMYVLGRQNGLDYILQYDFRDDGMRRNYTEDNFGLVRHDFTPKPSFAAVAYMTRRIGESKPLGDVGDDHARYRLYKFADADGGTTYVAWSVNGEARIRLPEELNGCRTLVDIQGNETEADLSSGELTLGENPVYIK